MMIFIIRYIFSLMYIIRSISFQFPIFIDINYINYRSGVGIDVPSNLRVLDIKSRWMGHLPNPVEIYSKIDSPMRRSVIFPRPTFQPHSDAAISHPAIPPFFFFFVSTCCEKAEGNVEFVDGRRLIFLCDLNSFFWMSLWNL